MFIDRSAVSVESRWRETYLRSRSSEAIRPICGNEQNDLPSYLAGQTSATKRSCIFRYLGVEHFNKIRKNVFWKLIHVSPSPILNDSVVMLQMSQEIAGKITLCACPCRINVLAGNVLLGRRPVVSHGVESTDKSRTANFLGWVISGWCRLRLFIYTYYADDKPAVLIRSTNLDGMRIVSCRKGTTDFGSHCSRHRTDEA